MLRLRTTTSLSLLALLVGAIGTHWLSGLGADWQGLAPRVASTQSRPTNALRGHLHTMHQQATVILVPERRVPRASARPALSEAPLAPVTAPELVPVSMPTDADQRWHDVSGHLDGLVVLQLDVDAAGRVRAADVTQSSGDPQLDARALHTVRRWRFAVPAGYPDGLHGELPMRFSSHAADLARTP